MTMTCIARIGVLALSLGAASSFLVTTEAQEEPRRFRSDPPVIESSWDDLLEGVQTAEDWARHRQVLRRRFLELIRDSHKPEKPALDLQVHEETEVDGAYRRLYISYQVEVGERAHAYLRANTGLRLQLWWLLLET